MVPIGRKWIYLMAPLATAGDLFRSIKSLFCRKRNVYPVARKSPFYAIFRLRQKTSAPPIDPNVRQPNRIRNYLRSRYICRSRNRAYVATYDLSEIGGDVLRATRFFFRRRRNVSPDAWGFPYYLIFGRSQRPQSTTIDPNVGIMKSGPRLKI